MALVTGANRGLGDAFARALVDLEAKKVYAAARDPHQVSIPGVTPIHLDINDHQAIGDLAGLLPDVTMLINNAGIHRTTSVLDADCVETVTSVIQTNLIGTLAVSTALAPVIIGNGGGVIANMLSAGSWLAGPRNIAYSVSKAAALSMTNNLRAELNSQGVQVTAIHAGFIDTDMMSSFSGPKATPRAVADAALTAIAEGAQEVLFDDMSRKAKAAASGPVPSFPG